MTKNRVRHHVNPLADQTEHMFDGFDNMNNIVMDIGADRGEFTQKLIDIYGDQKNFIVCEIRKPLARRLQKKFENYKNVVVFDGDIVRNIQKILTPSIQKGVLVEEVYINFPDPWFKERHKKRRVVNLSFLKIVKKMQLFHTKFIFQTDQKQLFDDTKQLCDDTKWIMYELFDQSPHGCTTKWEDKKTKEGSAIYRMMFTII